MSRKPSRRQRDLNCSCQERHSYSHPAAVPTTGPMPRRRALSSTLPAPREPGRARSHSGTGRTDQASPGPLPAQGRGPRAEPRLAQRVRTPPAALPTALPPLPPTFSTLRGPLTSSCRLGIVPPSHPILLPAALRFRLRFPRTSTSGVP